MLSSLKWKLKTPQLLTHTNTCLSTFRFSENDILTIIQKLDPSKAHGDDKKNIRMLKLSDKAINLKLNLTKATPLYMIFTSCLETGVFPLPWKKCQRCTTHMKESKQLLKNYRPASLLPICGKIFERLIYN